MLIVIYLGFGGAVLILSFMKAFSKRIQEFFMLKGNILILSLTTLLFTIPYQMWHPYLPLYVVSLGGTAASYGLLISIQEVAWSTFRTPFGYLSDRKGRKGIVVAGTFLYGLTLFLYGLAWRPLWALLFIPMVMEGVIRGAYTPALSALTAESVPKDRRGMAYAAIYSFPLMASAASPLIGIYIWRTYGDWCFRLIIFTSAASLCIAAIIRMKYLTEPRLFERRGTYEVISLRNVKEKLARFLENLKSIAVQSKPLTALLTGESVRYFAAGLVRGYVLLYAWEVYQLKMELGLMLTLSYVASPIITLTGGKLCDRLGRKPLLLTSWVASSLFPIIYISCQTTLQVLLTYILFSLIFIAAHPALSAIIADFTTADRRATAIGLISTICTYISLPSPYIGGLLYEASKEAPFIASSIIYAPTIPILLLFVKEERKVRTHR